MKKASSTEEFKVQGSVDGLCYYEDLDTNDDSGSEVLDSVRSERVLKARVDLYPLMVGVIGEFLACLRSVFSLEARRTTC